MRSLWWPEIQLQMQNLYYKGSHCQLTLPFWTRIANRSCNKFITTCKILLATGEKCSLKTSLPRLSTQRFWVKTWPVQLHPIYPFQSIKDSSVILLSYLVRLIFGVLPFSLSGRLIVTHKLLPNNLWVVVSILNGKVLSFSSLVLSVRVLNRTK